MLISFMKHRDVKVRHSAARARAPTRCNCWQLLLGVGLLHVLCWFVACIVLVSCMYCCCLVLLLVRCGFWYMCAVTVGVGMLQGCAMFLLTNVSTPQGTSRADKKARKKRNKEYLKLLRKAKEAAAVLRKKVNATEEVIETKLRRTLDGFTKLPSNSAANFFWALPMSMLSNIRLEGA